MCRDCATSGLGGRHIYFRYNATSGDIVDNTIEQNVGMTVEILFAGVLEFDITMHGVIYVSIIMCM